MREAPTEVLKMPDNTEVNHKAHEVIDSMEELALPHRFAKFLLGNMAAFGAGMFTDFMYNYALGQFRRRKALKQP
jgi:hypothetical protein